MNNITELKVTFLSKLNKKDQEIMKDCFNLETKMNVEIFNLSLDETKEFILSIDDKKKVIKLLEQYVFLANSEGFIQFKNINPFSILEV